MAGALSEAQLSNFVESLHVLEAVLGSCDRKSLKCFTSAPDVAKELHDQKGVNRTHRRVKIVARRPPVVVKKRRRKQGTPKYANGSNFSPASIYYNPSKLFYAQARQNGSDMRTTVRTHYGDPRALVEELQANGFKIRFVCEQAKGKVKMQ